MKVTFTKKQLEVAISGASTDPSRTNLNLVRFESSRLVSCNGHLLYLVDIVGDATDETVHYVSRAECKRIVKMLDAKDSATIEWEGGDNTPGRLSLGDSLYGEVRTLGPEITFPDYQQVIPKSEAKTTVRLGAAYLKNISAACKALGARFESGGVELAIIDDFSPVRFTNGQGFTGVLMPQTRR